jgi:hypothetical protein
MAAHASRSQRLISVVGQAPGLGGVRRAAMRATRVSHRLPAAVVPVREELPQLLNRRGLLGCGVEVGVKRGEYSEFLLSTWEGRHLISVDPWAEAPADDYVDIANVGQKEHDGYHADTVGRLQQFGERSSVWRMFGNEAAEKLPHHCLDFVYLDARHDRASVAEDLAEWFPRLRPGAVFAGHDYIDGIFVNGEFGVRSAVDGFFGARGLPVRSTFMDGPWESWYVVLPRSAPR